MTNMDREVAAASQELQVQTPNESLLSLGGIATRHLIARTSETDIIVRSIEHITQVAENTVELQMLTNTVKQPYERLFLEHAKQQPNKCPKQYFSEVGRNLRTGRWTFSEATDGGTLTTNVVYGFERTKEEVSIRHAEVKIVSLHDATAKMSITFRGNTMSKITLGWEEYFTGRGLHPHALLKQLEDTELGELIDKLIAPYSVNQARGKQSITFKFGSYPVITTHREGYYYPEEEDKDDQWSFNSNSDFQYHPEKHIFIRQHGLKDLNDTDNLTSLTVEESAVLVHQLLKLVPTVSI